MSKTTLLTLVAKLKECPAQETEITRDRLLAIWAELQRQDPGGLPYPTAVVMAAVMLHDSRFARLLDKAEAAQLQALVQLASDRYEQTINPPNKLGRLLASIINKE
jgi:hypothetical protein